NLVNAVVAVVGDDGLGTEVGFRLPPTVFGNLGYAMLCSATVGDAIRLCLRFHYLITRGIDMSLHVNGEQAVLEMAHKIPLPEPIRHL
ncbi:MAG: AraC family transcriptional regulator ligand-binding domain-containing protein, partial [Nevskiales bacterium]